VRQVYLGVRLSELESEGLRLPLGTTVFVSRVFEIVFKPGLSSLVSAFGIAPVSVLNQADRYSAGLSS
jgi:hypothetical protein